MAHVQSKLPDVTRLKRGSGSLGLIAIAVGVLGLIAALVLSMVSEAGLKRFFFGYLYAYSYFLAIGGAAVIWVLISHVVRAGWIVNVRRIIETFAANAWVLGVLALPILFTVVTGGGPDGKWKVYSWAVYDTHYEEHHGGGHSTEHGAGEHASAEHKSDDHAAPGHAVDDHATEAGHSESHAVSSEAPVAHGHPIADESGESAAIFRDGQTKADYEAMKKHQLMPGSMREYDAIMDQKRPWLNPIFFTVRILFYLGVLAYVGRMYHKASVQQDTQDEGPALETAHRLGKLSAPLLMACGLCLTLLGFDLFMSLDPHWFSTMFSVYWFAGGTQAMWALVIVMAMCLQRGGYLRGSVSTEHYQDLGKWLFAFVFFWGYVTFSQYMLQWYANLPEETFWFQKRGASVETGEGTPFSGWMIALVLVRFLLPFPFLISKHIKRRRATLFLAAIWILGAHLVDSYLIVVPEGDYNAYFGPIEILAWVGVGGVFLGMVVKTLASHELRPIHEPRAHESLAFQNI